MDTLNVKLLRKIWALAERGVGGEAQSARARAEALVKPHGYTLADIPMLLDDDEPQPAGASGFTFYDMSNPAHQRAYARHEAARRAAWRVANADKIAEVMKRYGSEEAVFAPTPEELALDAAVEPFKDPRVEGRFQTFDGESFRPTPRVAEAMGRVIPWPETIPDALVEYEAWEKLYDDRNTAAGNDGCDYLSEGADLRRFHVQDMIQKLIPARDLSDLILRMRFLIGLERSIECPEAILADLERLEAQQRGAFSGTIPMPAGEAEAGGLTTATQRRESVRSFLSTMDGAAMSDREVARRFKVSPTTVGKIRSLLSS